MNKIITTTIVWTAIIGGIYLFETNTTIQNWLKESSRKWVEKNKKKCSNGDGDACYNIARAILYGESGLKKDTSLARELYTEACNMGSAGACTDRGFLYGEKQDYNKALYFYRTGCDLNSGQGCFNLGILYYKGEVVQQNTSKAITFFKKACDNDHEDGCVALEKLNES